MTCTISQFEVSCLQITPKTSWIFVSLRTQGEITGIGEATLNSQDAEVVAAGETHQGLVLGADANSPDTLFQTLPFSTLPEAAFSSAVMQAIWDIAGRKTGKPTSAVLGDPLRTKIPVYANINRRTLDRTPEGFANSASDAISAGFTAIKIAPFDGLDPEKSKIETIKFIDEGVARVDAVRRAIGSDARLMLDCHWRFNEMSAQQATAELAQFAPYWIECPIDETVDNIPTLLKLRSTANSHGIRLAGCETMIKCEGFKPYLVAGAYDVMMPDIQYAGGPCEMLRIAELFELFSVEFSPHNPTGPIAHAAVLQICANVSKDVFLETQFDESPLFYELASRAIEPISNGWALVPQTPGIGVELNQTLANELNKTGYWSSEKSDREST